MFLKPASSKPPTICQPLVCRLVNPSTAQRKKNVLPVTNHFVSFLSVSRSWSISHVDSRLARTHPTRSTGEANRDISVVSTPVSPRQPVNFEPADRGSGTPPCGNPLHCSQTASLRKSLFSLRTGKDKKLPPAQVLLPKRPQSDTRFLPQSYPK